MNPETYPHRKDTAYGMSPDCRCGADDAGAVGIGATWGADCPAALLEALEAERGHITAMEAALNNIIDREPVPEGAPEIIHTMERHYRMTCDAAGKNGDMVEDLCRAVGVDPDCDDPVLELRKQRSPGPHITPALMRRIEALGFVPGSGEPVGWLLGYVEGMAALLTTAQGERAALDKLVGDLQNEVRARIIDGLTALGVSDADYVIDGSGSDGDEIDLTSAEVDQGFSVVGEMVSDLRARVAELEATLAARSAGGGGS